MHLRLRFSVLKIAVVFLFYGFRLRFTSKLLIGVLLNEAWRRKVIWLIKVSLLLRWIALWIILLLWDFPPLSTPVTTTAGNAPDKSSYANVTGKPSGKKLNIRTLFTLGGNGIDVVIPVESIRAISDRFANIAYGFFLGKRVAYPVVANYGRSSYAGVMIELRADVELKDNIVVAMPRLKERATIIVIFVLSMSRNPLGKLRFVDDDGNPLVPTGIMESDSEVKVVFNETANLRISTSGKDESDKGYGTNSLLGQWRDSYPGNDDYDPYDDDMYENHDMSKHLQSICDDLDITVRGRKKK
uniref:Uncharacterized protein n=1 Tax=Tanacetum cinerariifolium TaxID=118510 RepID=A0A6L2JQ85_TANCI|nr:hypothetical protein [Tanacetum cinerariifolium]